MVLTIVLEIAALYDWSVIICDCIYLLCTCGRHYLPVTDYVPMAEYVDTCKNDYLYLPMYMYLPAYM